MANWNGMCRSNYVRAKNPSDFEALVALFPAILITREAKDGTRLFGFYTDDGNGMVPSLYWDGWDDPDEDEVAELGRITGMTIADVLDGEGNISILDVIHHVLADGEVMVVIEAGHANARYVSGVAWAIHSSGECIRIDVEDEAVKQAKAKWGVDLTRARS